MRALRRVALAALVAWLLAACAGAPPRDVATDAAIAPDAAFDVSGRLSARRASDGVAASFRWTHRPGEDDLVIATPLGQALATLSGRGGIVRLQTSDGRVEQASDWETLTAKALGAPIPVRGLAWWIRGFPHGDSAHTAEHDTARRVATLWQDGWQIDYEYDADAKRPARLRLRYPDVEVRLVVDAWSSEP
jgi:outer membrane lipoprotein LolB